MTHTVTPCCPPDPCSYIGQLKYEDPNIPDANATAQLDLPGSISVFTGRNYDLFDTIEPPAEGEATGKSFPFVFNFR